MKVYLDDYNSFTNGDDEWCGISESPNIIPAHIPYMKSYLATNPEDQKNVIDIPNELYLDFRATVRKINQYQDMFYKLKEKQCLKEPS